MVGYAKPEPRGPRPRKPLRRSRLKRKKPLRAKKRAGTPLPTLKGDPAAFDKEQLRRIYGEDARCFLCPMYKAADWHHNFKRQHGPRQTREIFSSVFNAIPLSRDLHTSCPFLSMPELQILLFWHTVRHVNLAVAKGQYGVTEIDLQFLAWVREEYDGRS